jgi:peptidoglycan hydrolase-like protein with peptidoglycan-binding domain
MRQVQQKLNDLGYNAGQVDGIWGPNTKSAITNFQHSKGLQATGRLDENTANALGLKNLDK